MKDDSHNFEVSPELELRIVAWVLGEASDLERDQLQHLLAEHPSLVHIKSRFESLHGLLREIGTDESDVSIDVGDDWKLPAERRRRLLAVLDGRMVEPAIELPSPETTRQSLSDEKQGIWRFADPVTTLRSDAPQSKHRNFWGLSKSTAALVVAGCLGALAVTGFLFFNVSPSMRRAYQLATRDEVASNAIDGRVGSMGNGAVATPHFRGGTEAEFLFSEAQPSASVDFTTEGLSQSPTDSLWAIRESLRGEQSLPSPSYLNDDVQYFPAGPESPLARSYVVPVPEEPALGKKAAGKAGDASTNSAGGPSSGSAISLTGPMSGPVATTEGVEPGGSTTFLSELGVRDNSKANVEASDQDDSQRPQVIRELSELPGRPETISNFAAAVAPREQDSSPDRPAGNNVETVDARTDNTFGYRFSIDPEGALADGTNGRSDSKVGNFSDLYGKSKSDESVDEMMAGLGNEVESKGQASESRRGGGDTAGWFDSNGPALAQPSGLVPLGMGNGQSSFEQPLSLARSGAGGGGYPLPALADEPQSTGEDLKQFDGLEDRVSEKDTPGNWGDVLKPTEYPPATVDGEYLSRGYENASAKEEAAPQLPQVTLLGREANALEEDAPATALSPMWESKLESAKQAKIKKLDTPDALQEMSAAAAPFSTFSLHVSDVSFKLAQAALSQGTWPKADTVRVEEFVNAFDYGDPLPSRDEKVACQVEQAIHPFLQQRNVLRVSLRTAAQGRAVNTPLRITFLLDNSGSMERIDRRQTVHRAFALLAQQLSPIDQVTLISFARQPRLLADKVSGEQAQQLVQRIEDLPSEGGTNIELALQLAFEKAQEQQMDGAQNRIVLLTDGAVNLGDANPQSLSGKIALMRDAGIAFDAAGISADGLNDNVLEALTRQGDGRYYLLDSQEAVDDGFARQIAGALRPSAKNVKVQVEFNPSRVGHYKLLGFEKHLLKPEDFRDDAVDAAEMAATEAGVAVYQFEAKPDGEGDVGSVSVRFLDLSTGQMVERRWPIPYEPGAMRLEQAAPALRVATSAALFAAKLRSEPLGEYVDLKTLGILLAELPDRYRATKRIEQFQRMIEQAQQVNGN